MAQWYIAINGQQQGPLSLDQMMAAVQANGAGNVHVFREGFTDWKLANEVADIRRRLQRSGGDITTPTGTAPSPPGPTPDVSAPSASLPDRSSSQNLPGSASHAGFIGRHWRGELPLWMSYWIVTILGQLFVSGVILGAFGRMPDDPRFVVPASIAAFAIWLPVNVWQIVGLWRSAANDKRRRRIAGATPLWGIVVQALIVVWIALWLLGAARSLLGSL